MNRVWNKTKTRLFETIKKNTALFAADIYHGGRPRNATITDAPPSIFPFSLPAKKSLDFDI